jgi:hypothetical protein
VLTIAEDGLAVAVSAAGVLTVAEDGLAIALGAAVSTAGVLAVAVGAAAAATGAAAAATGAAAAAAQCSEIMFSSVTAKLLSAAPELTVPLALCPMSFTSWPTCGLRSTLLVVILKIWRVPPSATV